MAWARTLWLLIPLAGIVELALHRHFAERAPEPGAWQAARAPLAELRTQDELVVVAPHWAEPLARQAFGEELMPLAHVARPDATQFRRAIEVSILGQRSPELAGWRTLSERREGGFAFRLLENPSPAQVAHDFVAGLTPGAVRVTEGGRPCPHTTGAARRTGGLPGHPAFPAERFDCAAGELFFAGVTVIDDEEYHPRRGVRPDAAPRGPLVISFRDVPLGKVIRGYTALPWLIFRDGIGTPVQLEVRIDGQSIGSKLHRDEDGWSRFELPTGSHAGKRGNVDFVVTTQNVKDRHFCFYADTR